MLTLLPNLSRLLVAPTTAKLSDLRKSFTSSLEVRACMVQNAAVRIASTGIAATSRIVAPHRMRIRASAQR
jgi:hypothetical protein